MSAYSGTTIQEGLFSPAVPDFASPRNIMEVNIHVEHATGSDPAAQPL